MEVAQAVEPTTRSHAPVEEHDESLFHRNREDNPRHTVGQVRDHPNTQLVVQAATDAATDIC